MRSIIAEQSSTSHTPKEETQGLLEKVNIFVKERGGFFELKIHAASVSCQYVHPSGISSAVADSFASPSDIVVDVMNRATHVLDTVIEVQGEEMMKDVKPVGGIQ